MVTREPPARRVANFTIAIATSATRISWPTFLPTGRCEWHEKSPTPGSTLGRPGPISHHCDIVLAVPAAETARVQEVHLVTYHAICAALEQRLLARSRE